MARITPNSAPLKNRCRASRIRIDGARPRWRSHSTKTRKEPPVAIWNDAAERRLCVELTRSPRRPLTALCAQWTYRHETENFRFGSKLKVQTETLPGRGSGASSPVIGGGRRGRSNRGNSRSPEKSLRDGRSRRPARPKSRASALQRRR
jgi:hypothetical protein